MQRVRFNKFQSCLHRKFCGRSISTTFRVKLAPFLDDTVENSGKYYEIRGQAGSHPLQKMVKYIWVSAAQFSYKLFCLYSTVFWHQVIQITQRHHAVESLCLATDTSSIWICSPFQNFHKFWGVINSRNTPAWRFCVQQMQAHSPAVWPQHDVQTFYSKFQTFQFFWRGCLTSGQTTKWTLPLCSSMSDTLYCTSSSILPLRSQNFKLVSCTFKLAIARMGIGSLIYPYEGGFWSTQGSCRN